MLADGGCLDQLESWFQESDDQSEGLRRKFVDGRKRVPDVLCPRPELEDPWNRVIDLWSTRVKELGSIFLTSRANLFEHRNTRLTDKWRIHDEPIEARVW